MSPATAPASDSTSEPPTVRCKHCKQQIDTTDHPSHSKQCLRDRKKKKEKEKQEAISFGKDKENINKLDGTTPMPQVGSSTAGDGGDSAFSNETKSKSKKVLIPVVKDKDKEGSKKTVNSKKRKVDEGSLVDVSKPPTKKQKKKEEAKAKAPKPKGPVDVEKQCGVLLPNGAMCARSLTCKSHAMGAKRAVPGRSMPYDMLLAQYQKKNQAKQQKAALASTAPLPDDLALDAPTGNVDSDEEKEAVMLGIGRAGPRPLFSTPTISTKSKYSYIRMKEMLAGALGGSRGGGLFCTTSGHQTRSAAWVGSGATTEVTDIEAELATKNASSTILPNSRKSSLAPNNS